MDFKKGAENFLHSNECRKQKNGIKNAWQIFWRFSRISGGKKWEGKKREFFFEASHEYQEQINGGKKRTKNFL